MEITTRDKFLIAAFNRAVLECTVIQISLHNVKGLGIEQRVMFTNIEHFDDGQPGVKVILEPLLYNKDHSWDEHADVVKKVNT